jgi:pimeloyl-ACP methyl ester carboxylesterase
MYFEDTGSGEPIVFVSGQNTDHTQWKTITPLFSDFRTIAFDTRGTGSSDKPSDPYSLQGFADDTAALLDALDIPRAHFIGASMGGKIVQWLLINHPSRVASAVLMATTPGGVHEAGWDAEVGRVLRTAPTGDGKTDPIIPLLVSEQWASQHSAFAQAIAERRMNPGGAVPRRLHYQASMAHDTRDALPSIATPVLVLHGEDDRMSPLRNAELLHEGIAGSRLVTIPNGRHEFFVEFPDESLGAIREFLAANPIP